MKFNGIRSSLIRTNGHATVFVPLPVEAQRKIDGGCQCDFCKAHPEKTPMWDTLAVDAKSSGFTWMVHNPVAR